MTEVVPYVDHNTLLHTWNVLIYVQRPIVPQRLVIEAPAQPSLGKPHRPIPTPTINMYCSKTVVAKGLIQTVEGKVRLAGRSDEMQRLYSPPLEPVESIQHDVSTIPVSTDVDIEVLV